MGRPRRFVILLGGAAAAVAVVRHRRGAASRRRTPGGILIGDVGLYEALSRLVLGPFFEGVAADVAAVAPDGARVLEVGCGPGHLSIRLARRHGLEVTGLDLDPAMIGRARAIPLISDPHADVRAEAAQALAIRVASPEGDTDTLAVTGLRRALADPGALMPLAIASGIATVRAATDQAGELVRPLLRHPSARVREAAQAVSQ